MEIRRLEITKSGSCKEYFDRFAPRQNFFAKHCRDTFTHSQVRWNRVCWSMVLEERVQYLRVVRVRPDVSIFSPISLSAASGRARGPYHMGVAWKPGCPLVGGDWFYFMDFAGLESWWRTVEASADRNHGASPYFDFFAFRTAATISCQHYPVVIQRSSR